MGRSGGANKKSLKNLQKTRGAIFGEISIKGSEKYTQSIIPFLLNLQKETLEGRVFQPAKKMIVVEEETISEQKLHGIDFTGSVWKEVSLNSVSFKSDHSKDYPSKFKDSFFYDSSFLNTSFVDCELPGASFEKCLISDSSFIRANLENANFSKENSIKYCGFHGANMKGTDLSGTTIKDSDFPLCVFSPDTSFKEANLENVGFAQVNIIEVDFSGVHADQLNFTMNRLDGADFSGATIKNSLFKQIRTREANVEGSGEPVVFENAELKGTRFLNSNIPEAVFKGASLERVSFSGCDLAGIDFSECNLEETSFIDCNIEDCIFPESVDPKDARFADCYKASERS